jgi:hypothetical protein
MGAEQNFVTGEKMQMVQGFATERGEKMQMVQDFATETVGKTAMEQGCPMGPVGMVGMEQEPAVQMVVMQVIARACQTFAS